MRPVVLVAALVSLAAPAAVFAQQAAEVIPLAQFVQQALQAGPDVLSSRASLASARASYTAQAASNGLGLDVSGSAKQNAPLTGSQPGSITAGGGVTLSGPLGLNVGITASHSIAEDAAAAQSTSIGASARMNIWDGYPGGAGLASVQKASLSLQGSQLTAADAERTLVYRVKQSYYSLLAQQRQLAILQATLAKRVEETRKTQALYDAQSATPIDLKQAKVNQRQAELDLLKAQDDLDIARQQLSALVGWPLDKGYTLAEEQDLPVPTLTADDAVKTALANRADLKQLDLQVQSAQVDLAQARGKTTPTVSASADLNWQHQWSPANDSLSASLGVTVNASVIDGGAGAAQVTQQSLAAQKLQVQRDQLVASITTGVRDALASLRDLEARVELAQSSLELAQASYDSTKIQFDSGVKSNLDVLADSVSLTSAQVSLAKARADAQLGVLALQNTLGN